jgi:phage RecT family recombinase
MARTASAPSRNGAIQQVQTRPPAIQKPATGTVEAALADPSVKAQLELVLPSFLSADRFLEVVQTELRKNPKLARCSPTSFLSSVITAAQLGLEIGVNGGGYLVPYGATCTFVPGWKGLVNLVSRAGRATVWTGAVFEGDELDYALGDRPFVTHRPGDESDPEKLTHVYAIGRVAGSDFPIIEVWTAAKAWRHRDRINKVGRDHYSYRHPEMYARKVPLLQVIKYLPSSTELATALDLNDQVEIAPVTVSVTPEAPQSAAPQLTAKAETEPAPAAVAVAATPAAAEPAPEPTPAPISQQQLETIIGAMEKRLGAVGAEAFVTEVCAVLSVEDLSQLPADQFSAVMKSLADDAAVAAWSEGKSRQGRQLISAERIQELLSNPSGELPLQPEAMPEFD